MVVHIEKKKKKKKKKKNKKKNHSDRLALTHASLSYCIFSFDAPGYFALIPLE